MIASPYPQPPPDDLASLFPKDRREEYRSRTLVMGILNVTPDSFSDGGRFYDPKAALDHAQRMIDEGADLLDIGGESTRPGSESVGEAEELRRVLPVLKASQGECPVPLSIDTTRANVARAAVERGARMINDVSGLRFEPEIAKVAAESDAFLVIMHSRATPRTMQLDTRYDDLLGEVADFLNWQGEVAIEAGMKPNRIILDPGIGFGKSAEGNLELLRRQGELLSLGYALLVGTSRKSFIGRILGDLPPDERVEGTAATVALAIAGGARIVRVHDVKEMARVAKVSDAVCRK